VRQRQETDRKLAQLETMLDEQFGVSAGSEDEDEDGDGNGGGARRGGVFCDACNKGFKAEKQYENHAKSKKHQQNVARLREMFEEEDAEIARLQAEGGGDDTTELFLGEEFAHMDAAEQELLDNLDALNLHSNSDNDEGEPDDSEMENTEDIDDEELESDQGKPEEQGPLKDTAEDEVTGEDEDEDDEVAAAALLVKLVRDRNKLRMVSTLEGDLLLDSKKDRRDDLLQPVNPDSDDKATPNAQKLPQNKKAARRAAEKLVRDEQQAAQPTPQPTTKQPPLSTKTASATAPTAAGAGDFTCRTCQAGFASKTKLFDHLQQSGHAIVPQAAQVASSASKKKEERGKKAAAAAAAESKSDSDSDDDDWARGKKGKKKGGKRR
jgi:DnaJ family protein A protein 5